MNIENKMTKSELLFKYQYKKPIDKEDHKRLLHLATIGYVSLDFSKNENNIPIPVAQTTNAGKFIMRVSSTVFQRIKWGLKYFRK